MVVYLAIIIIAFAFRGTSLNNCTGNVLSVICLGGVDGFLFLMSFPGWIFWWLIVAMLPRQVSQAVENVLTAPFRAFGMTDSAPYILFSFIMTGLFVLALGGLLDRLYKK